MSQYPTANIPNGYQIAGQALGEAGRQVGEFSDRQEKMRAQMEEMTQKRAAAILAQQEAELRAKQLEQDTRLKAEADQRAHDFALEAAKGNTLSTNFANDPKQARRTPAPAASTLPGQPTPAELDDLGNVDGLNMPSQSVRGGDSATAMMGDALDRQPIDPVYGRTPLSRDELLQKALEMRQLDAKDYGTLTKPAVVKPKANPEIARAVRDEMILRMKQKLPLTKDDIRDIVIKNDPDGTFMASKEFSALVGASSPRVALEQADLASKRYDTQNEQFGIGTNIKLKEALDSDPFIKPYASVARKYDQTVKVYDKYKQTKNPAFVDRALVVNFNKLIDETSAVMGGEVDATIREMGVGDRLLGKIGKWQEGGAGFTDDERDQIMDVMKSLHDELKVHAAHSYYTAKGQAIDLNADPEIVTGVYSHLFEPGKSRYTPEYRGEGREPAPAVDGGAPAPAPRAPKVEKRAEALRQKYNY